MSDPTNRESRGPLWKRVVRFWFCRQGGRYEGLIFALFVGYGLAAVFIWMVLTHYLHPPLFVLLGVLWLLVVFFGSKPCDIFRGHSGVTTAAVLGLILLAALVGLVLGMRYMQGALP